MNDRRHAAADAVIRIGFWLQPVFLLLVDLGTLAAMRDEEVGWVHYLAFALVNLVLCALFAWMWSWMRQR